MTSQINVSDDTENMIGQLQSAVASAYQGAAVLQSGSSQVGSGLTQLQAATKDLPEAAKGMKQLKAGFTKLTKNDSSLLEGANQLSVASLSLRNGASSLVSGASQLTGGIGSAASGIQSLKSGADSLKSGSSELTDGLKKLDDGAAELKDGAAEFKDKTSDIDQQIDDEIDEMLDKISGSDYTPVSFASADNKDIGLVQFTHPGKKLNFMGNELGEYLEWRDEKELGWNLLTYPIHDSLHEYVKALHKLYLEQPALYKSDYNSTSFRWIDADNKNQCIYAYRRSDPSGKTLYMVFNFSGSYQNYILKVEQNGAYKELLNSDRDIYSGSNCINSGLYTTNYKLPLRLAPLSSVIITTE